MSPSASVQPAASPARSRVRRWTLGAVAAVVAVAALAITFRRSPAATPAKSVVRLKWVHQAQFAGFYEAEDKFYRSGGLDVEIRPGGVDFPAIQMVASGSEDFGVAGADQILLANEKGIPVVAIATIYRRTPFVLFARRSSGIASMKDFVGKNVGVKLGGNEELTYRAMLRSAGVDAAKVHEVPVKYDIGPFLAGAVDVWPGYVINEVLAAQEKGVDLTLVRPADYNINFYADTLFTRQSVIDSNPGRVKAFVQATMAGWHEAVEHPEEAAALGCRLSPQLDPNHEIAMMRASIPLLRPQELPLGKMEVEEWRSLHDQLLALGFLKHPVDIDKAFTNRFVVEP
jgi:ABC-type nitrate/sulfonate/bicarbonate transport system substrate-binding protein